MIKYIKKDVTTVTKGVVAHGCNCQGVMGSGVALAIKNKWARAFESYVAMCQAVDDREKLLGRSLIVSVHPTKQSTLFVANLFTQVSYGRQQQRYADPQAIAAALRDTAAFANAVELPLYMPRIGCGLGGLEWDADVKPTVEVLNETYPELSIYVCDL